MQIDEALRRGRPVAGRLRERMSSMVGRIVSAIDCAAEYYALATAYEQLSRLSDAELRRRGLSRATLAHDISSLRSRSMD
jgi:hypothetical protein